MKATTTSPILSGLVTALTWAVLVSSAVLVVAPSSRTAAALALHTTLYLAFGGLVLFQDWRAGNLGRTLPELYRRRVLAGAESWALIGGGLALFVAK